MWMEKSSPSQSSPLNIAHEVNLGIQLTRTLADSNIEALQDLLLIPRTPSPPREPTPLPLEEKNMEDLTPEEMRELVRRQQVALSLP